MITLLFLQILFCSLTFHYQNACIICRLAVAFFRYFPPQFHQFKMQVNNEQSNTQRMLEHNRSKERVVKGSLQRSLVDVVSNNIDMRESTILNCLDYSPQSLRGLFSDGSVESDADAQLLIKLKFNEKVDCSNIKFSLQSSTSNEVSGARMVKLFVNRNDMDFGDVESLPATAVIEVPFESENGNFSVSLAGSKFTRIQSLQIFVEDNFGTDRTRLGPVRVEGFIAPSYHTE